MNNKIQSLSSLDVFLLALIDSGVTSSYAMREQAGISVGASRPALQRLKRFGLVEEGEAEARNKLAFRLTRRGRRAKVTELNRLINEYRLRPPSDPESIIRIAAIAAFESNTSGAGGLLRKAAEECSRRAGEFQDTAKENVLVVADIYEAMMASCSAAHFKALSGVFSDLAANLKKSRTKRPIVRSGRAKTKNKV